MKNYLKNKTVLITGATSGIGEQLSYDLAILKTNLILVGRNEEKLKKLKINLVKNFKINVKTIKLDIRIKKQVIKKLENLKIDILINNAGLALGINKIYEGNMDNWDVMIDTNIKGLLYVSRVLLPFMKTLKTAHIVNLGSVAGKMAYPGGNVYCATKAALKSLSQSMNVDLFGTNVKITTIAPGAVKTNFSNIRFKGDAKKANAVYEGYTPLGSNDISSAIIYVLNTPPHVNIQNLDIMPTDQRNPYLVFKK